MPSFVKINDKTYGGVKKG